MLFQLLHLHTPLHGQTVPKITVSHHHNNGHYHSYRYTDLYPNTGTIIIEMLHFLKKYKLVLWNYLICSSLSNIYFEACICMLLKWTERIAANKQNQGHNFFPFQDPYIRGEHLGTGPDTPGHHRFVDTPTLHGTHQVVLLCPTYLFTIKAR